MMCRIALLMLALCLPRFVQAEESFRVYAPSPTTETLWIVEVKPSDEGAEFEVAERVELGFAGRIIASHPEKPLLYIAGGGGKGAVVTLDDKGNHEKLVPIKLDSDYSYLALDRKNRFLMGASYGGGEVDIYRLDEEGLPKERVTALDEGRKLAHAVLPTPDNRFLYIPYVKENNAIFQYRFDEETGKATPLEPLDAEPPEGTGPRHLVYHPSQPIVYFSNEQDLGISSYNIQDSGQLKLRQVVQAVDEDEPREGTSASDLVITPNGQFIFSGLRGLQREFDQIARFKVKENGDLERLGLTGADKIPWGLELSPNGKYLLVTAYEGATLTAYRIGDDGDLKIVGSRNWDKRISDLIAR